MIICSDRSPVSCNLTLGDILQHNQRQERSSRRPRMSALLASATRFYASTFDRERRRLQVMARRGVATLIDVASCVVSGFTFFFSSSRKHDTRTCVLGPNCALPSAIINFKPKLSVSSPVIFLHVYTSFIIKEKPNHFRKEQRGHRTEGRGEVLPSPGA